MLGCWNRGPEDAFPAWHRHLACGLFRRQPKLEFSRLRHCCLPLVNEWRDCREDEYGYPAIVLRYGNYGGQVSMDDEWDSEYDQEEPEG